MKNTKNWFIIIIILNNIYINFDCFHLKLLKFIYLYERTNLYDIYIIRTYEKKGI